MQQFLPFADFDASAHVIDPSRLGNNFYREGLTLLRGGWPHHPCARMWQPHPDWHCRYLLACARELERRGTPYPHHVHEIEERLFEATPTPRPWWLGDKRLHSSHRANLLRKDPAYYGHFGWPEKPREGYFWPSHHEALREFMEAFK